MKITITLAHNNECSESMSVCACASVCEYEQNRPKERKKEEHRAKVGHAKQ